MGSRYFIHLSVSILVMGLGMSCFKQKVSESRLVSSVKLSQSQDSCAVTMRIELETKEADKNFNLPTPANVELQGHEVVVNSTCEGVNAGDVFALNDNNGANVRGQRYVDGSTQKINIIFDASVSSPAVSAFSVNGTVMSAVLPMGCLDGLQSVGRFISGSTNVTRITVQYELTVSDNGCSPNRELNFVAI